MQEIDTGFSSITFSSTMTKGVSQNPDFPPLSPVSSNFDSNSFRTSFSPTSPVSPVIRREYNRPQFARHSSFGDDSHGLGTGKVHASPVVNSGHATFSPVIGSHTPISLDARSSQFSAGSNQLDPHSAAFLPPPPNLDGNDVSKGIARSDNSGSFLSNNEYGLNPLLGPGYNLDQDPPSHYSSIPKKHSSTFNTESVTSRDRSFSSPGPSFRQIPYGAKSPAASSSNQTLYEDRPYEDSLSSSWNEGSGFPAPIIYRTDSTLSPRGTYDRFSLRPPRHGGVKNHSDMQGLLSPTNFGRPNSSDGGYNFSIMSGGAGEHNMSPVCRNSNHIRSQSHGVFVSSATSFDASTKGGQANNNCHAFGSGGIDGYISKTPSTQQQSQIHSYTLNQDNNERDQANSHSRSLSLPPPGFMQGSSQEYVHTASDQEQFRYKNTDSKYIVQKPQVQHVLQRHHSTGSHNIFINERGQIIGHSSPIITQGGFDSQIHSDQVIENFSQNRQHRSNSYSGHQLSPYSRSFDQAQDAFPHGYNPRFPDGRDASTPPSGNEGIMFHQRHSTEPILPNIGARKPIRGKSFSGRSVSSSSDDFNDNLVGERIDGLNESEESSHLGITGLVTENATSFSSYANTLAIPRSCSIEQAHMSTKTRGPRYDPSSQPLTAGANLSKSGPKMVYNVKFKRIQRSFVLGQRVTREIKIGCYVKVEADRGEDLGIVLSVNSIDKYLAANRPKSEASAEQEQHGGDSSGHTHSAGVGDLKRILRVATHDEISLLELKREEEEELLKVCRAKIRQRGLNMSVIDAEYQFDRNKLTFFFEAEGRIDFRELVRDLFSMYKTRIWMQQIDKDESPRNRVLCEESA